jgi:MFS family permease
VWSVAAGAAAVLGVSLAPNVAMLTAMSGVLGVALGVAMTTAYALAGDVIPPRARGVGFGVLTTSSLAGIALSPILAGALGATSIRAVFVLDAVGLAALTWFVARSMRGGGTENGEADAHASAD